MWTEWPFMNSYQWKKRPMLLEWILENAITFVETGNFAFDSVKIVYLRIQLTHELFAWRTFVGPNIINILSKSLASLVLQWNCHPAKLIICTHFLQKWSWTFVQAVNVVCSRVQVSRCSSGLVCLFVFIPFWFCLRAAVFMLLWVLWCLFYYFLFFPSSSLAFRLIILWFWLTFFSAAFF